MHIHRLRGRAASMWLRALPLAVGRNPEPFLRARPLYLLAPAFPARERRECEIVGDAGACCGRSGQPPCLDGPLSPRHPPLDPCSFPARHRHLPAPRRAPSPSRKIPRTLVQIAGVDPRRFRCYIMRERPRRDGPCSTRSMVVSNAQNAATGWTSFHRSGGLAMTGGRCVTAATVRSTSSYARRSSPSLPSRTTRRDPERRPLVHS